MENYHLPKRRFIATLAGVMLLATLDATCCAQESYAGNSISAAWNAGQHQHAYALLRQAYRNTDNPHQEWGNFDHINWVPTGPKMGLTYRLAGLTVPGLTKDLVRQNYRSADDPGDFAQISYTPMRADGPLADYKVTVRIYPARQMIRRTVAEDVDYKLTHSSLSNTKPRNIVRKSSTPALGTKRASSEISVETATGVVLAPYDKNLEQGIWQSRAGIWIVEVRALWPAKNSSAAQTTIGRLIQAMDWSPSTALFHGETPDIRKRRNQFQLAVNNSDWVKASKLAEQLLPDSVFPNNVAWLRTAQAMAASSQGNYHEGLEAAQVALKAWRYSGIGHSDENLYGQLLLQAADSAFRTNHPELGGPWIAQHAHYQAIDFLSPNWHLDDATGNLTYRPFGVTLPAHLGTFVRVWSGNNIAYYAQLHPAQRIGVTFLDSHGLKAVHMTDLLQPDATGTALQKWLTKQRGLKVGAHTKGPFAPATQGVAHGAQWRFDIERTRAPNVMFVSARKPAFGKREMGFWLSRLPQHAIVLRSEWGHADQAGYQAALQAADAFPWPDAIHPTDRPENH